MSNKESSRLVAAGSADVVPTVRYVIDDCGDRVPAAAADDDDNNTTADNVEPAVTANDGSKDRKPPSEESRTLKSVLQQPQHGGSGHKSGSVQINDPPLTETRSYYVNVDERPTKWTAAEHGPLHSAIPIMPLGLAITCCGLNILLPGTGTMISAFSVFCQSTSTRLKSPIHAFAINLAVGFVQLATFIVIFGWIWSILWGMTFIQLALSSGHSQIRRGVGGAAGSGGGSQVSYYVRRHSSVVV